jgi:hypothetical protein
MLNQENFVSWAFLYMSAIGKGEEAKSRDTYILIGPVIFGKLCRVFIYKKARYHLGILDFSPFVSRLPVLVYFLRPLWLCVILHCRSEREIPRLLQ